jgi:hypothetical protein
MQQGNGSGILAQIIDSLMSGRFRPGQDFDVDINDETTISVTIEDAADAEPTAERRERYAVFIGCTLTNDDDEIIDGFAGMQGIVCAPSKLDAAIMDVFFGLRDDHPVAALWRETDAVEHYADNPWPIYRFVKTIPGYRTGDLHVLITVQAFPMEHAPSWAEPAEETNVAADRAAENADSIDVEPWHAAGSRPVSGALRFDVQPPSFGASTDMHGGHFPGGYRS